MKLAITAAVAIFTIAAAYGAGQFTSKKIYTEIEIDAPTHAVWQQLSDTGSYPEWNPFIKQISGNIEEGQQLEVSIQSTGKSPMTFKPRVLKAEKNHELRWVGKLGIKGIFDGEHYFIMEENTDGKTIFRHGENFSGMIASLLFGIIEDDTRKGFEAMNEALKTRVEVKT